MGMGCCARIAQMVLVIVNFVVFACGCAILGVGIALRVATDDTIGWLVDIVGNVLNWGVLATAFYLMIAIGAFLMMVGFFGCCGACKKNTCMLTTYIFLVVGILILQIIGGILAGVFLGNVDDTVETAMKDSVTSSYGDGTAVTSSWDNLQYELHCCGAVEYLEYQNSQYFTNTGNSVPKSCCVSATREGGTIILGDSEWTTCKTAATNQMTGTGVFYTQGCYASFTDWLRDNLNILIGVMVGLGVFQVITIIFACCILKQDDPFV